MQGGIKNQLNNGIYNAIGLVPTRVINSAIRLYISHQRDTGGQKGEGTHEKYSSQMAEK